jgi:GH24 family phage-related lysozyme (muramidase)
MTALQDIQRFVGVDADGFLGPKTLAAIARALGMATGLDVSKKGLDLIKQFEGCKLAAYPDPGTGGAPWTIGYGHTGAEVKKGLVWTQAQADSALADDVSRFADGVSALLGSAPTSQGQYDAMVSLAFNVGLGNLKESTLLRLHKEGDYAGAADQFARWRFAAGKELPGLVKRRAAEAALYRGRA